MRIADAVTATGGVPVQPDARDLSEQWVKGEITAAEMKQRLLEKHTSAKANEIAGILHSLL